MWGRVIVVQNYRLFNLVPLGHQTTYNSAPTQENIFPRQQKKTQLFAVGKAAQYFSGSCYNSKNGVKILGTG